MRRQESDQRIVIGEALTAKAIVIWYESFTCTPPSSRPLLCTSPGPRRYLATCRFLYKMLAKFPKGFQRGKRRKGWILKKLVRFPLWPSGESENHTEGSRWLFAYFLANEKVWHPLTMTKPFIKMRHASGGCLSCSGKKDTKEPARGGTDREACRCRCVSLPCTPASSRPPRDPSRPPSLPCCVSIFI